MKAAIRAILLDGEARSTTVAQGNTFGKLREPMAKFFHLHRAFDARRADGYYDTWDFSDPETLNQQPLRAPSVFNFYGADSAPPGPITHYKALVCVFLFGGNDSHNSIVPITTSEYNAYSNARGGPAENNGLALPKASLLPLSGNNFGLHPALPNTAALYNAGKAAVVANTGVLLAPTTLAQYNNQSVPLPPQLFSHSDMQSHWQTMRADQPADTGWGGRMADVFKGAATGGLPVSVTLGSGGTFMKGEDVSAYQVLQMRYKNGVIDTSQRIARYPIALELDGLRPAAALRRGTTTKTLASGTHFGLLRQLDEALKVFYDATTAMGLADSVTTMTMSDFGRTLKCNGQGSDHGWGEHAFVVGGAVNGGRIVGQMPPVALGTSVDVGEGRLLPATASGTYAATLAKWLGATDAELDAIFPNLSRFPTRTLDLFV